MKIEKFNLFLPSIIIFILICINADNAYAASSITLRGTWSRAINKYDLMGGAGTDLAASYSSSNDQATADITLVTGTWSIDVRKITSNWNDELHLFIRRTSDGTGDGSVSGGSNFQEITDTDMSFFSGNLERFNIGLQFMLNGVSIRIPPANYTATIYLTVTETQ
jgi:hypothetical protein